MNNGEEDPFIYNWTQEIEFLINRPVAQVWKQHLNLQTWVITHRQEWVSGSPDKIGSVVRTSSKVAIESGMPTPNYHYCKIIKLVPERQYVLKTFTEEGGSYGWEGIAFDDTRFIELEGKTKLIFNIYGAIRTDATVKDPASLERAMENSRNGVLENFENLKRILESR